MRTIGAKVRLVQYRARKQAADLLDNRLLTRAVLYRRPGIVGFDSWQAPRNLVIAVLTER